MITLSKTEARRFILTHQNLYPPRMLSGKDGITEFISCVNSIQFDPINVVGRNPDLVLQSRIKNYKPIQLDELLYEDRQLIDGWDKMASIYLLDDWPKFSRHRLLAKHSFNGYGHLTENDLLNILNTVQERGPISSLEFNNSEIVDWHWGPTKIARAVLESLNSMGKIGIHHRLNNRRYFDVIEKLIPQDLLTRADPFPNDESYQEWHVLRRIKSMGMVNPKSGDYWLGILGVKAKERSEIINRLIERDQLVSVQIYELPKQIFYACKEHIEKMDFSQNQHGKILSASIIAPLDNFLWDRRLIKDLFDFNYVWEVYKPKKQRIFGYYVLPILLSDQFIARFEPKFDKKTKILTINNWWWEDNIVPNSKIFEALIKCLTDFCTYLDTKEINISQELAASKSLEWIRRV
jgi:uncharacterized protein YcaQ